MSAKNSPINSRRSSGPLPTLETGGDSPTPHLARRQSLPADPNGASIERLPEHILGMRTSLPREVLEEPEVEGTPEAGVAVYPGGPKPVAGVLEKWVNYGKGWRQRWFVLERGLLSYYKLSGPDKVSIAEERLRHAALHILGKEAHKDTHESRKSGIGGNGTPPRPLGSVHMMLASIRESAADEKKFYVHTGTKTLHLRAQSKEDRALWVSQLREAKAQFKDQRGLLPPAGTPLQDSLAETLQKLRVVLAGSVEQGKMNAVEELVKEEAGVWQGRLQAEREKRRLLLEYVRTLEADKVELETAGGVVTVLVAELRVTGSWRCVCSIVSSHAWPALCE